MKKGLCVVLGVAGLLAAGSAFAAPAPASTLTPSVNMVLTVDQYLGAKFVDATGVTISAPITATETNADIDGGVVRKDFASWLDVDSNDEYSITYSLVQTAGVNPLGWHGPSDIAMLNSATTTAFSNDYDTNVYVDGIDINTEAGTYSATLTATVTPSLDLSK